MILSRYERMLAKRYLLPTKGEGFIFVVAGFSVGAVARPLGPQQSRWLDALEQASHGALQPEPDAALRASLTALSRASKTPGSSPEIWRYHPDQLLRVDVAGYLHVEPAEAPERLYELALAEPERTLRAEVLRELPRRVGGADGRIEAVPGRVQVDQSPVIGLGRV